VIPQAFIAALAALCVIGAAVALWQCFTESDED